MRVGYNPNKDKKNQNNLFYHKIIIPVYIPNFHGYFEDSFRILKICLESVLLTIHNRTSVCVVSNGSCDEVVEYLKNQYDLGFIQELIIHRENIGKLNSILKAINGTNEILYTITDADVLFTNNWQKNVEDVFKNLPNVGVVSTTPGSKSYGKDLSSLYCNYLFSKRLKFQRVQDENSLVEFAKSIGDVNFYNESHLSYYLTFTNNNCTAVAGAAHFTATYRKQVLSAIDITFTDYSLGGSSEKKILDEPVLKLGLYRFSTIINYTFHLGNKYEPWMKNKFDELVKNIYSPLDELSLPPKKMNLFPYWFVNLFFTRIFFSKKILKYVLRYKKLPVSEINDYLNIKN